MPPKDLNQGISASRAGSAQKKPPTAIRGRPLGRGRGGSRSSTGRDPNRPSVLQRPQDIKGKARQRQADVSVAESDESRTSISSSDDEDWTRIESESRSGGHRWSKNLSSTHLSFLISLFQESYLTRPFIFILSPHCTSPLFRDPFETYLSHCSRC